MSKWLAGWMALALLGTWPAAGLELKAGVAKAVITPQDDKARITVMGVPTKGKEHDLYARALVLDDGANKLAIVTYDLNCLDVATPILRVECRDKLGIPPSRLILLATHNHQAPIQIVPDNFDYGRWLAERIFALIQEAIAAEQGPVRVGFGSGEWDCVTAMGSKTLDKELQVLKVSRGDQPVAVLFNYPAHPLQSDQAIISVGHCGYAVDAIEAAMPGVVALYADAAGGNQFTKKPREIKDRLEAVKAVGKQMADATLKIAQGSLVDVTGPIQGARLETFSLPLAAPMPLEEAKALAAKKKIPLDIGYVPYPHPDRETNWVRALIKRWEDGKPFPAKTTDMVCTDDGFLLDELPEAREFPCKYEETIGVMIGPMIFIAMQGEVCSPLGLAIKDAFRKDHPMMVFGYMGEHNLYIPTREIVERDMYQSDVLRIQYASPVGWPPEVGGEMVKSVTGLIDGMLKDTAK